MCLQMREKFWDRVLRLVSPLILGQVFAKHSCFAEVRRECAFQSGFVLNWNVERTFERKTV